MRKLLAIAAVVLPLSACAGDPDLRAVALCDAYAQSLSALAGMREAGTLSDGQVATVERLRPRGNALCGGEIPTTDRLIQELDGLLLELLIIQQGGS